MKSAAFLFIIFIFIANSSSAQEINVTGTVVNAIKGNFFKDFNVVFENTSIGTSTDNNGRFSIKAKNRLSRAIKTSQPGLLKPATCFD